MLDTGINRLGIRPEAVGEGLLDGLEIETLMSHLACADEDSPANQAQLDDFTTKISRHTLLHEDLKRFFDGFPRDAHPMPVLSSAVSALSTFYQDSLNPFDDQQVDMSTIRLLAPLCDEETTIAVSAERGVMIAAEGDCKTPIGAYARRTAEGTLHLAGFMADPDGKNLRTGERTIPWPETASQAEALGRGLGTELHRA